MLIQISCEKLIQKTIKFHNGLNPIIGDNVASNSIGKSIMLMIIDFVFGGSSYIEKNRDVIENIGDHSFNFIFRFDGENYFFSRNTRCHSVVSRCNEQFEVIECITLSQFNRFLQGKYNCVFEDTTFREIIGRYFRIYGKENLNEKKPIQYFDKEKYSQSIINLLKLFDRYKEISHIDYQFENEQKKKDAMKLAMNVDLIPSISKREYVNNKRVIADLEGQILKIKEAVKSTVDTKAVISSDIIQLKEKKSNLIVIFNVLKGRLRRIESNIDKQAGPTPQELERLKVFFPDLNIDKITEVEEFHRAITTNLNEELNKAKKEIELELASIDNAIQAINSEIEKKLLIDDAPSVAVDSLIDLSRQMNFYQEVNRYYEKDVEIKDNVKILGQSRKEIKSRILSDLSRSINSRMAEIHSVIYPEERRPPNLTLSLANYRFDTFDDTGTGTAFANLIAFDLSLLGLTQLPALAHDLPLLKNIENFAFSNIVKLYTGFQKQIFIAIDKLNSYDEETEKTLRALAVLELSKDKVLFGVDWKTVG